MRFARYYNLLVIALALVGMPPLATALTAIVSQTAYASSAVIDLTPVGYKNKNNYYVVFVARPLSAGGSSLGHAFVGVGIEHYDSNQSSYIAYGVWSKEGLTSLLNLEKIPGKVLQETLSRTSSDSSGHSPFQYTQSLIVKVTEKEHDQILNEIQRENRTETAPPLTYVPLLNDCVTFASRIAKELGLNPPERNVLTPGTWLPEAFLIKFRDENTKMVTMSYPAPGEYPLPGVWTGPVVNGLPHGEGTYNSLVGNFTGEMKFGKYDRGTMHYLDGHSFDGTWNADQQVAEGKMAFRGAVFQGRFDAGKAKNGTLTVGGNQFSGEFANGVPSQGIFTFQDGATYDGTVSSGIPVEGTYRFSDGGRFHGSFYLDGGFLSGTYQSPNGISYVGLFAHGNVPSDGTFKYPDGSSFSGKFSKNGKPQQGTYEYADGSSFFGTLNPNGIPQQGTYRYLDGSSYSGTLDANGKPQQGTYRYADGSSTTLNSGSHGSGDHYKPGPEPIHIKPDKPDTDNWKAILKPMGAP
jgi:hypothetical protein